MTHLSELKIIHFLADNRTPVHTLRRISNLFNYLNKKEKTTHLYTFLLHTYLFNSENIFKLFFYFKVFTKVDDRDEHDDRGEGTYRPSNEIEAVRSPLTEYSGGIARNTVVVNGETPLVHHDEQNVGGRDVYETGVQQGCNCRKGRISQ